MKNKLLLLILVLCLLPQVSFAATIADTGFENICSQARGVTLPQCIQNIYLLSLGLGSIVALFILVIAGFRYMTASGNAQQVEGAKESFAAALTGLVIIFIAFILLNLINPDLVRFRADVNSNFQITNPAP